MSGSPSKINPRELFTDEAIVLLREKGFEVTDNGDIVHAESGEVVTTVAKEEFDRANHGKWIRDGIEVVPESIDYHEPKCAGERFPREKQSPPSFNQRQRRKNNRRRKAAGH